MLSPAFVALLLRKYVCFCEENIQSLHNTAASQSSLPENVKFAQYYIVLNMYLHVNNSAVNILTHLLICHE